MLTISESYASIDEELDVQKQGHNDTFRLWIVGSKPEIDFMAQKFIWANKDNNGWFNARYNQNPPVVNGKPFFQFPPSPIKEGENWRFFIWRTKTPEFVEAQLRSIQLFLRDVNTELGKVNNPNNPEVGEKANPKLDAFLTKIEQVRDYIENTVIPSIDIPTTKADITAKLGQFVNELASSVSDEELIEKVNAYLVFSSIFSYSFTNTFLIYIQNKGAREVLSKGKWAQVNMRPKSPEYLNTKYPGIGAIGLWTPITIKNGKASEIAAERKWRQDHLPNKPMPSDPSESDIFYNKSSAKTGLNAYNQISLNDYVQRNASKMAGYSSYKMRFNFLDVNDVEQIPEAEVVSRPSKPEWHTSEPDEIADHLYETVVEVIKALNLKFKEDSDMGGSKGSSSNFGDITLLASNAGIGRASTAIHELAHSLTHQTYLTDQIKGELNKKMASGEKLSPKEEAIQNAYVGRDERKILELQAEGIAFVVMRYYDIPADKLQHSAAYISLWRNDKDAVQANLDIIRTTAKEIIKLMNMQMGVEISQPEEDLEEEDLSFLYEMSIIGVNRAINEIKKLKKILK
jgi:hypothetical protein